jgi:PKD repeat protein
MRYFSIVLLFMGLGSCFVSCTDDDFPVPAASTVPKFTYTIDNDEFAPATVTFTNTSIVPQAVGQPTYYWNFGNGDSSTEVSPSYTYLEAGAYEVKLVVTTSASLEVREEIITLVVKDPNAVGTPIYFTNGNQLFQGLINDQAPIFTALAGATPQSAYDMVYNSADEKLYISDLDAGKIYRCNTDGSDFEDFRSGLSDPIGMAIDYDADKLYWTTGSGIQSTDLGSTDVNAREDFVTGQTNDPEGVAIHAPSGKLFWGNYSGGIWSKNLDGSNETLVIPDIETGSMSVIGDRIYYDEYVGSGDIRIKSAALDGTNITTIATGIGRVVYGIGFDASENKMYWGDRDTDALMRANLDGSETELYYQASSDTRGIVIIN